MKSLLLRLILAFATVIFFLVVLGSYAAWTERRIYKVQREAGLLEVENKNLHLNLLENRLILNNFLSTTNPDEMDALFLEFWKSIALVEEGFQKVGLSLSLYEEMKESYEKIINYHYDFFTHMARRELSGPSMELFQSVEAELVEKETLLLEASENEVRRTLILANLVTILICIVALLVSVGWAVYLRQRLTDKARADSSLRALRSYLQNIIDSMPSLLISVDRNLKIVRINRAAAALKGVDSSSAVGSPLFEVFPLGSEVEQMIQTVMSGTKSDAWPRYKEGDKIWEVTVFNLEEDEKGAVIRLDEVGEKIRLEEVMVQTEKMMSVGGLAAGMAHEINNPLAGIIQTATVMERRLTNSDTKANIQAAGEAGLSIEALKVFMEKRDILKMMETIRISGGRIADIVKNMLSFSRRDSSSFSEHDPVELLENTLKLASTDFNLKKKQDFRSLEIIREYEENLPPLFCQGAKIQQVILNILKNGAQAMHDYRDDGIFTLTLKKVNSYLIIEIGDNGPGMDEEVRRRVFEPFFTTKEVGIGTGLGLSVSYFIVTEDHKGEMSVLSAPGRGSKFIIRLPL